MASLIRRQTSLLTKPLVTNIDSPVDKSSPEKKAPNIRDVAAAAGVSRSTVSLVINGSPVPSAATRAKVLEVVQELNYQPDPKFRQAFRRRDTGLGTGNDKTQLIGVLTAAHRRLLQPGLGGDSAGDRTP